MWYSKKKKRDFILQDFRARKRSSRLNFHSTGDRTKVQRGDVSFPRSTSSDGTKTGSQLGCTCVLVPHCCAFWLARNIYVSDRNYFPESFYHKWINNKNDTKALEKRFFRALPATHNRKQISSATIYAQEFSFLFHNLTEQFLAPGKSDVNPGACNWHCVLEGSENSVG